MGSLCFHLEHYSTIYRCICYSELVKGGNMTPEHSQLSATKRPYEQFGFTEQEHLFCRVNQERFEEILDDKQTFIHKIEPSSNDYGEFLFLTTSRPGDRGRLVMTFFGLGYHEYRERWITNEWFWFQSEIFQNLLSQKVSKEDAKKLLKLRAEEIGPLAEKDTQTKRGELFEILADLTDEDGALAEMEDLESFNDWLDDLDQQTPLQEPPPTGEYLLDQESRENLPTIRSGEELGLEALAQVKFFTPDSNWTWYASEFDGEDIFFGLVSGFELEFGNFSLSELQQVVGPLGLPIERDIHFEPKKLGELLDWHRQQRKQ